MPSTLTTVRYKKQSDSVLIETLGLIEFYRPGRLYKLKESIKKRFLQDENYCNAFENDNSKDKSYREAETPNETKDESYQQRVDSLERERKQSVAESIDSELLSTDECQTLVKSLPSKTLGKAWSLIYSGNEHGMSLTTLYQKTKTWKILNERHGDITPCVLIIKDSNDHVFGYVSSCLLRISGHEFLGTGESFLFTIKPNFKIFSWTGQNDMFLNCGKDYLRIGSNNSGRSKDHPTKCGMGLFIDKYLEYGRSTNCQTFQNESLSSNENFLIQEVELWSFEI